MRNLKRIVAVCGCIGVLLVPFSVPDVPALEQSAQDAKDSSSTVHRFKSSSRMKKRDKSKSSFNKRKHFGQKRQARPPAPPKQ